MGAGASTAPFIPRLTGSSTGDDVAAVLGGAAKGKTVVITGPVTGLGFETARVLAAAGSRIVGMALPALCVECGNSLRAAVPDAEISVMPLDLADLDSVRQCAAQYVASGRPIDILICNAGVMSLPRATPSKQGYELQWAVNALGHHALVMGLLPALRATASARVIYVSSAAHALLTPPTGLRFDLLSLHADDPSWQAVYDPWECYAMSKLACAVQAAELQRRSDAGGWGITAASLHPGAILGTQLKRHVNLSVLARMLRFPRLWHFVLWSDRPLTKSIAQGVATTIFAALTPDLQPAGYYSDCRLVEQGNRYLSPFLQDATFGAKLWDILARLTVPGITAVR